MVVDAVSPTSDSYSPMSKTFVKPRKNASNAHEIERSIFIGQFASQWWFMHSHRRRILTRRRRKPVEQGFGERFGSDLFF
jgi:hypothetical protein